MLALLGILDLLSALILLLTRFFNIDILAWLVAMYLIIKGIIFISIPSVIDILVGVVIIFAIFGYFNLITWIAFIWLIQKAVLSFY